MWEGDPVGVDPKRPLVGFALVAVLCAVLMSVSVGKGYSFDLFQPGKPIASSVGGGATGGGTDGFWWCAPRQPSRSPWVSRSN